MTELNWPQVLRWSALYYALCAAVIWALACPEAIAAAWRRLRGGSR